MVLSVEFCSAAGRVGAAAMRAAMTRGRYFGDICAETPVGGRLLRNSFELLCLAVGVALGGESQELAVQGGQFGIRTGMGQAYELGFVFFC